MADTPRSSSRSPSRSSTPNPRFTSQSHSAEDLLKEQTVGLVHLSDFRKRRAEAMEQLSRDGTPMGSGATTPDGREPAAKAAAAGFKKRKKVVKKGGLSFGGDDEGLEDSKAGIAGNGTAASASNDHEDSSDTAASAVKKRGLQANSSVSLQPKAMTKSALLRDAQLKERLRKGFLEMQEAVKATEFILPFVFFDGKNTPGGACRMKKGDFIWLFLERARKVGATSSGGQGGGSRKDWARIGVDDLMLVRGEIIVPHHYHFHHFILNRTTGYDNRPIFSYAAEPTAATPKQLLPTTNTSNTSTPPPAASDEPSSHLKTAAQLRAEALAIPSIPDSELEGFSDDPALTKVVDRRWYERNKHIYPASMWEDFDPNKDYSKGGRKDGEGNAFFFSR